MQPGWTNPRKPFRECLYALSARISSANVVLTWLPDKEDGDGQDEEKNEWEEEEENLEGMEDINNGG